MYGQKIAGDLAWIKTIHKIKLIGKITLERHYNTKNHKMSLNSLTPTVTVVKKQNF